MSPQTSFAQKTQKVISLCPMRKQEMNRKQLIAKKRKYKNKQLEKIRAMIIILQFP